MHGGASGVQSTLGKDPTFQMESPHSRRVPHGLALRTRLRPRCLLQPLRSSLAQSYRPEAVNFLSAVEVKRTSLGEHAPFVRVVPRSESIHFPNSLAAFNAAAMIGPGDTETGSWFAFSGGHNPAALKAAAITALTSRGRRPL